MKADLRSDTITRPDDAMLDAMRSAEVGDDCYGDDAAVNELQDYCAELFGKDDALFTCSGTMSNQIALRSLTAPGDEVILDHNYHINFFESGASSNLAQVVLNTIHTPDGILTPAHIQAAIDIKPRSPIYSNPRLICLENTMAFYGGTIFPLENHRALHAFAKEKNLRIHTDGARILHACVATGRSSKDFARYTDTVSLCFAKGLGAPFGSILAGPRDVIERARIFRKWYGGGLHQAGYMAAAALYGLRHNYARLAEDHEKAQTFNSLLRSSGFIHTASSVPTNIVLFDISATGLCSKQFVTVMEEQGVRLFPWPGTQVRAITHQNISLAEVDWAARRIIDVAGRLATDKSTSTIRRAEAA